MDIFIYFFIAILYIVTIVTLYHSLNLFTFKHRILLISFGLVIMYLITQFVYSFSNKGASTNIIQDARNIILATFVPINSLITLPFIYKNICKIKAGSICLSLFVRNICIVLIIFIVFLIFEANYIKSSIISIEEIVDKRSQQSQYEK